MRSTLFAPVILSILIIQWILLPLIWQWGLKSALNHLQEGPAETISLSLTEFEQSRIGRKEILLNGCMYDIRSKVIKADSVSLVVKRDFHEEEQLQNGKKLWTPEEKKHPEQAQSLAFFYQTYLLPESERLFFSPILCTKNKIASHSSRLEGRMPECPEQPPQLS